MYPLTKELFASDRPTLELAEANTAGRTPHAAFTGQGNVYRGAVVGGIGLPFNPMRIGASAAHNSGQVNGGVRRWVISQAMAHNHTGEVALPYAKRASLP